ncbi:MAG TPA: ABC transporter permease [Arachidicoccus soli]|uniref:FtsX-like permease family protein n=1 Tax=Arachidicoccus soli TaxID=2341117 RepID=A0A386HK18_9BACT|nr:ABC transporter permease [Arachidicoccus soli]AYD46217.1 FtsX-like permease family protein [Arachidicoccus soli]HEU0226820.1 ABC transporter permease [Arachidicoccus soli]
MNLLDSLSSAFRTVKSNKLRTGITVTIIALGIMALIGIVTSTTALKEKMQSSFSSMGANGFTITYKDMQRFGNQVRVKDGKRQKKSNLDKPITKAEAELFKQSYQFPAKVSIALDATGGSVEVHYKNIKTNPNVTLNGGDENYLFVNGFTVAVGRNLSVNDVSSGRNVCVLGNDLAVKLFGVNIARALDKMILVGTLPYRVVGVLTAKGSGSRGSQDNFILTSYNNIRRLGLSNANSFSIGVAADNVQNVSLAASEAMGVFRRVRKLLPNEADNFVINKSDELTQKLFSSLSSIEYGVVGIGCITLFGAAIGLMNIMLVAVSERTKEIGLVKAIGGKKKNIRQQFLFESIIISLMGAFIGILLGIMIGNVFASFMKTGFVVPWVWVTIGIISCSVTGLLAGLYPAIKASKLNPIEALRYE